MRLDRKVFLILPIWLVLLFCPIYPQEQPSCIKTFFSPPQDLNRELARNIDTAQKSIDGCFYAMNSEEVAYSLIKAQLRGVNVQIVMDESRLFEEDSFYPQLKNFGIAKKDTITKGLMHNKFCVIDEKFVWTGSYNPSSHAVYTNNDAVVIKSEELAEIYLREFSSLWDSQAIDEKKELNNKIKIDEDFEAEVYFSPEEGDVILQRLNKVLEGAKTSIYFAQFTVTHPDIAEILIKKAKGGIEVQGVMEYEQIGSYSQYPNFELAGMNIRKDKNYCFSFHHKFFIIDGKTVITGSLNPTKSAFSKNRENVLIINSTKTAQKYLDYFKNIK